MPTRNERELADAISRRDALAAKRDDNAARRAALEDEISMARADDSPVYEKLAKERVRLEEEARDLPGALEELQRQVTRAEGRVREEQRQASAKAAQKAQAGVDDARNAALRAARDMYDAVANWRAAATDQARHAKAGGVATTPYVKPSRVTRELLAMLKSVDPEFYYELQRAGHVDAGTVERVREQLKETA